MNKKALPCHIAFIMDGNGRWAKERGLNRTAGHSEGAEVLRQISIYCSQIGIKYITMYAFSTENWNRPKLEVSFLMRLLNKYLKNELKTYNKYNTKFKAIGDLSKLPKYLQETVKSVEEKTSKNIGMTQILALNYGSKDEIIRAIKKLKEQDLEVNEANFENCLDTAGVPNVDLLIRTSGEVRLSNYLLWQNAYAEMFFVQPYWPDFSINNLDDILNDYRNRERRFGAL